MKIDLNKKLPLLILRNTVLYPGITTPVGIARDISRHAVERSKSEFANQILVVTQTNDETPALSNLPDVGVVAFIQKIETEGDQLHVLIEPLSRVKLSTPHFAGDHWQAEAGQLPDIQDIDAETESALLASLQKIANEVLELLPLDASPLQKLISSLNNLSLLTHICSSNLDIAVSEKQSLLALTSLKNRTLKLLEHLTKRKDELQVRKEIRDRLNHKLGQGQREAILREQLRAIREELGEGDASSSSDDSYGNRIETAQMPEDVRKVALGELKRLENIGASSPESHVIRNYLDLLCSMPWSQTTATDFATVDLKRAREVLDADHYGLDKIKKRILDQLAVMKLKKSVRGSILLFIGPPGVGKTSLGQSITRALGRKFIRASLGGVRDDSEIRGHRRTYVGAMPGRIIQGIKRAGESNPVFMLDEIDKMGRGFGGDPAAALLEVLDPEQNSAFTDHYLDVPYDLSQVIFIATANSFEGIPGPLLDRMEVIELSGYTTDEKLHIARTHLIPKVLSEFGMTKDQVEISDEALNKLVSGYTREAGVRELQRQIAHLARGHAERILSQPEKLMIRAEHLTQMLGNEKYQHESAEIQTAPGVVTGLAWTPQGGDILFVESSEMPGKGHLVLTGQLGEVMKESAQIALSLVRSRLGPMLNGVDFDQRDVHVHVPAGAIPKDGPSAGVTMLTTIASTFLKRVVDSDLAMTGEVTLRGAVMPVGGIKEKVIAAHRAGMKRVLLSRKNERDLLDVPEDVRKSLKFEFVDRIEDVFRVALGVALPQLLKVS